MPEWINTGVNEYCKRLPSQFRLQFQELPLPKRTPSTDTARLIEQEGASMLKAMPAQASVIALDERGETWSTIELANELERIAGLGKPLVLMIGGPDGLAKSCMERAEKTWSLSRLTLPHPFVRVVVAEAIYRAWSYNQHHPYHRA